MATFYSRSIAIANGVLRHCMLFVLTANLDGLSLLRSGPWVSAPNFNSYVTQARLHGSGLWFVLHAPTCFCREISWSTCAGNSRTPFACSVNHMCMYIYIYIHIYIYIKKNFSQRSGSDQPGTRSHKICHEATIKRITRPAP